MVAFEAPPDDKAVFLRASDEAGKEVEGLGEGIHRIVARHAPNTWVHKRERPMTIPTLPLRVALQIADEKLPRLTLTIDDELQLAYEAQFDGMRGSRVSHLTRIRRLAESVASLMAPISLAKPSVFRQESEHRLVVGLGILPRYVVRRVRNCHALTLRKATLKFIYNAVKERGTARTI